jgi:hypothetical protein
MSLRRPYDNPHRSDRGAKPACSDLFARDFPGADGLAWKFENRFEPFWEYRHTFGRNAVGLVIAKNHR